jgi:hypothetical protein
VSPASSRRRSLPCCGRAAAASSRHSAAGKALRDEATRPQASHTDQRAWSPPAADRRAILAHPIQPLPVDHAVEAATAQPPPTTRTKSKLTRRWPSTASASLKRHGPPRADVPLWTRRATTPPGHPSCTTACPTATLHEHSGRTQRTLEGTDTGRPPRTPEAGHWTPGRSDTRTGHRTPISWTATRGTLDALTGHRRGQGDDSTAGVRTSWASSPSDRILGRQPCSCSRTTRQLLSRSVGQAAPRRTALLGRLRVEKSGANGEASSVRPSRLAGCA